MKVLLLGGTGEARTLASLLVGAGVEVTTSLAGRVSRPALPVGEVRIGGFGGVLGLRGAVLAGGYDVVVDATHPFAATISSHAAQACAGVVPLLRLQRPGWEGVKATRVGSHAEAARVAAAYRRPFLTVGRQSLYDFRAALADHPAVARVVEPTDVPDGWLLLLSRGPYTLEGELALLHEHEVDVLVSKDSGGDLTRPKLEAAARLGVPVVLVDRPTPPVGVSTVTTPESAASWVLEQRGAREVQR